MQNLKLNLKKEPLSHFILRNIIYPHSLVQTPKSICRFDEMECVWYLYWWGDAGHLQGFNRDQGNIKMLPELTAQSGITTPDWFATNLWQA